MDKKQVGFNTGYALASGTLLASLVYFFASNWGVLERWQKIAPLTALLLALYGLYWVLQARPNRQFLSKLSLFCCCAAFGVGLLVIGQTYNSHADHYGQFAIWFAAAAAFSWFIRWQPFYVLSYVLAHCAYLFYFFPSVGGRDFDEYAYIGILAVLALANGLLYVWIQMRKLPLKSLEFLSYAVMWVIVLQLSVSHLYEHTFWWFNAVAVVLLIVSTYSYIRSVNQTYLLWNGLVASVFVILKYIEWMVTVDTGAFFALSLLFVALFLWGGASWVQYVKSLGGSSRSHRPDDTNRSEGSSGSGGTDGSSNPSEPDDTADAERSFPYEYAPIPAENDAQNTDDTKSKNESPDAEKPADEAGQKQRSMLARVLTVIIVAIGTVIGTIALLGFILVFLEVEEPELLLSGFGLLASVGMTLARGFNPVIRYTLLASGLSVGAGTALVMDYTAMGFVYLLLIAVAFWLGSSRAERFLWFAAGLLLAGLWLVQQMDDGTDVLQVMTLAMPVLYAAHLPIRNKELRQALQHSSYYGFLLLFLLFTLVEGHYVYDGMYALIVLGCIWLAHRMNQQWAFRAGLAFWSLFLLWKYYDTAWKLLHKSWSLALIGALLLTVMIVLERKYSDSPPPPSRIPNGKAWLRNGWIAAIVAAQLVMMGTQVVRNESLLASGSTVILELAPRDPRSMLQGDYVVINYEISDVPDEWRPENARDGDKVTAVVAPGTDGVHVLKRLLGPNDTLLPGEVAINGKWRWRGIEYGIESFFVEEGTGLEVERTAKYAEVRVGQNGNALLVRLLSERPN